MPSPPSDNPQHSESPAPGSIHPLEAQRRLNRDAAAALGFDPYGRRTDGLISLAEARRRYDEAADRAHQEAGKSPPPGYTDARPRVKVAGRIVLLRDNGKLIWLNLRDSSGDLQVAISQKDVPEKHFALAKTLDLGDQIVAEGPLMRTRTGEITVWASSLDISAKCLTPPPEKHAGLHDVETRYRRRYVDLWVNPQTTRVAIQRSRIVSRLRRYLDERGFLEVETPMLQPLAGGAAARPFITHMNALGIDLYLRIAPELYLKRLLVGGLGRVYEINRNFRNEGLDKQHNPEFTMLEVYQAYGDARTMMELVEGAIRSCAQMIAAERQDSGETGAEPAEEDAIPGQTNGSLVLPFGDLMIDYARPFERITYADLFRRALGFPMDDLERVRKEIAARGLARHIKGAAIKEGESPEAAMARIDPVLLVNTLFEEVAEKSLDPAVPTFITDYPAAISPLTRPRPENPSIADRADLFIAHMELAPMYTELNDPDVQEAKFREQLAGIDEEESTFRTFDQDFIDALKVGMPPAGGLGLGIDRLTMLLTNQRTIRDVILFPLMRPLE
jgi:lysyl-tRNA synthetase class 2